MIKNLTGERADGGKFDVRVSSPNKGPQIVAVRQSAAKHIDGEHLAFEMVLDPAGVQVHAPTGSVGFQMRVDFQSLGKHRQSTDGVTFYEGDLVPEALQLQTEIPAQVPFDDVSIELWLSE
jgi:hypothetical protein